VRKLLAVNDRGYRINDSHHNAKLTDDEVELLRQLRDGGMSYRLLAEKFEIAIRTVRDIVSYRRRADVAAKWVPARATPATPAPTPVARKPTDPERARQRQWVSGFAPFSARQERTKP
jgi:hypothetical protein